MASDPKNSSGPGALTGLMIAVSLVLVISLVTLLAIDPKRGPASRTTGEALVGGPFTLVNHEGETVTDQDFRGKTMLIYFGFTFCPDVCPVRLLTMAQVLDKLGRKAEQVQPMFISVDPERDTPEVMAQYVQHFHPRIVGLTGTPDQVSQVADAYRVTYYKDETNESLAGYVVNHVDIFYLMGPNGEYLDHFTHMATPDEIATDIRQHL